jgi:hypothetical protein
LTAGPEAPRDPQLRGQSSSLSGACRAQLSPQAARSQARRAPAGYPIAPTKFPKGRSTAQGSGARHHHQV